MHIKVSDGEFWARAPISKFMVEVLADALLGRIEQCEYPDSCALAMLDGEDLTQAIRLEKLFRDVMAGDLVVDIGREKFWLSADESGRGWIVEVVHKPPDLSATKSTIIGIAEDYRAERLPFIADNHDSDGTGVERFEYPRYEVVVASWETTDPKMQQALERAQADYCLLLKVYRAGG